MYGSCPYVCRNSTEIKHFFIVYKQLENKTTFVTEIDGVDEAKRVIQASIDAYNDLYLK